MARLPQTGSAVASLYERTPETELLIEYGAKLRETAQKLREAGLPHDPLHLEHFSIRLGVARVCEISFAFFFGNPFEKRGDCSPKLLNSARLHFA